MESTEFRLYSKSEAMKLLGLGKDAFNQLVYKGRIGVVKINGRIKIPHSELKKFIEENTIRESNVKAKEDINSFVDGISKRSSIANSIINNQIFNQLLTEVTNGKFVQ